MVVKLDNITPLLKYQSVGIATNGYATLPEVALRFT